MLFTNTNVLSARLLAVLTTVSILLSFAPVQLLTAEAVVANSLPFSDSFENTPAFSSPAWTADPAWGSDSSDSRTGTKQVKAVGNASGVSTLEASIDTSDYESIDFSFWYKKLGMDDGDSIIVEWYDGSSWTNIITISGIDTDSDDSTDWESFSTTLPSGADDNPSFAIRFTSDMNSAGNDKFFLEDVNLSGDDVVTVPDCSTAADDVSLTTFDTFNLGDVDGQKNWSSTGSFDQEVVENIYGFASFDCQSLRISNAVTSGSFGDQTFAAPVTTPAGESSVATNNHYEAQFDIASTMFDEQSGLFISVSPDDGNGSRMSYLGFSDESDGIHVIFYDVTNTGPLPSSTTWNESDIATLSRDEAHTVKFVMDFVDGPGNDVVEIYIDGVLTHTGTSWEDYYRYDAEQNGNGNQLFPIDTLIFRAGGTAAPATAGDGFLFDNLSLETSDSSSDAEAYQCNSPDVLHLDVSASDESTLYSVDATTGIGTFVQTYPDKLLDLAADENAVLYSTSRDGSNTGNLVILETDGSITTVGPTGLAKVDKTVAMNFAPDGKLYALTNNNDSLYSLNKATGAATLLHTFTDLDVSGGDLVVNSANELVYVSSAGGVYVIDLSSYAVTTAGTLPNKTYSSLALKSDTYYAMGRSGDTFVSFTLDPFSYSVVDTGVGPFDYGDGTSCPVEQDITEVDKLFVVKQGDLVDLGDLIASSTLATEPKSWFFYNDEDDTINNTLGSFVNGPDTAPLGDGSAEISVTGSERRNLATYQFSGTKLADITALAYSTYNPSAGNGGSSNRSGYFQFNVDFDGGDSWQKRLLFEPTANGTVLQDTWQEWDMYNSGNALWTWSGLSGHGGSGSTWPDGSTDEYRTWDELTSAFPDIAFRTTDSWAGVRVGSPYADGYTENIDKFVIGIQDGATVTTTTYDFEPTNYCAVTIVSDDTNEVEETEGFAQILTFVHSAWTAVVDGADWIWGDDPVEDPTTDETQTFTKSFEWSGGIADATLTIATDNFYEVYLNGDFVASSTDTGLFKDENKDSIDVSSYIDAGVNTLEILVTNKGVADSTYKSNPAGLKYNLTVTSDEEGDDCMSAPIEASLEITDPDTDYTVLSGSHTFLAEYVDADTDEDPVQWAIRAGTCSAGTNTVAGNVDGFSTDYDWDGASFSSMIDMSGWDDGDYCLIVNPTEDSGTNFRATRWFTLENPVTVTCEAEVNLLANASFEEPVIKGNWELVDPVDWLVEKFGSTVDTLMEIQRSVKAGWDPSDGEQYAELGGTEADIYTQTIPTVADKTYTLSWDFSPRPGLSTSQNQLGVSIDGTEVDDSPYMADGTSNSGTDWTSYSQEFIGTGDDVEIAFWDDGTNDSLGTFLDNVSLTCNPETGYSDNYCGDGEVNQDWEECEVGDEGCASYCLYENQCHADIQLMKITLDETDSASFDGKAYIGATDQIAPNGYWFNMDDFGSDTAVSVVSSIDGLALEYDGSQLKLAYEGGNKSGDIDYVQGSLEFMGFGDIESDDVTREINGTSYKLEPTSGSGGFPDAFDVTSSSTIEFDLRADTGNDGVTLALTPGAEFGQCTDDEGGGSDTTYYRIEGYVWNDEDSDGVYDEGEPYLSDWTLNVTNGSTTATTTSNSEGYFYFDVEAGTWTLTEDGQTNWTLIYPSGGSYEITVPEVSITEATPSFPFSLLAMFVNTAHADTIVTLSSQYDFGNHYTGGSSSSGGGGSSGGSSSRSSGGSSGDSSSGSGGTPQVAGVQTSVFPNGAPNAGAGGTSDSANRGLIVVLLLAAGIILTERLARYVR